MKNETDRVIEHLKKLAEMEREEMGLRYVGDIPLIYDACEQFVRSKLSKS